MIVNKPGSRVLPGDRVSVRGAAVRLPEPVIAAWNKPLGVEITMKGPRGALFRETLATLPDGCVPVGRLDINSSGLLLLTNDGELAHRLMHPRYGIEREYLVRVGEEEASGFVRELARGLDIGGGVICRPVSATLCSPGLLRLSLRSGRYHEVRRLAEAAGIRVLELRRIRYGTVILGGLARGGVRKLQPAEVERLLEAVGIRRSSGSGGRPRRRSEQASS
jgi:pseudouridine synthase